MARRTLADARILATPAASDTTVKHWRIHVHRASERHARRPRAVLAAALVSSSLAACGGLSPANARIDLQATPVATYDPGTGKTTLTLQFLVRDANGNSVDPGGDVQRFVDGTPVDVESVLATTDTRLATNLDLGVVLDASYSMTQWQPPALVPMEQSAVGMLQSVRSQMAAWGSFTSFPSWFQDQYVCTPASSSMPDADLLQIHAPQPGDATRLYAATAAMVDRLKQRHDALSSPGATDHFAMVVFTDGYDNYSYYDASGAPPVSYPTTDGGSFACVGTPPVSQQDLLGKLQAFPDLRVHVIGLGNQIKASELSAIAQAGNGRFVSNPDPGQVATLFGEIAREFTTLHRDGITMPLPPGDHEYLEQVTVAGATARVHFRFHAGDANATVYADTIGAQ